MSCNVVPSKVLEQKFVCIPPEEEMACRDWQESGKWIIVCSELDMSFVDRTWMVLQPLLQDGTLLMLKASTALLASETAVVQCYVKSGLEEAKRTAGIIRAAIDYYTGIMYYKLNELTRMAVARRYGHRKISHYMYTNSGRFYVRDSRGRWILEEEIGQKNVLIPSKFRRENYFITGSEELPSTSEIDVLNLPSSSGGKAHWYLRCRQYEKNQEYLPESDRVWIVARELLREGHFTGISWEKIAETIKVRLHVPVGSSLSSQLDDCDRIFREASVRLIMYFTRGTEGRIKYSYKYFPDGELYGQTEFAEKFVLQREQR